MDACTVTACYAGRNGEINVSPIGMEKPLPNPYKIDPPRKMFENKPLLGISF